jgi:hypothetical protein
VLNFKVAFNLSQRAFSAKPSGVHTVDPLLNFVAEFLKVLILYMLFSLVDVVIISEHVYHVNKKD